MGFEFAVHVKQLIRLAGDFESAARLDIDIVLKTNGRVKLVIRSLEDDTRHTKSFEDAADALQWIRKAYMGDLE